MSGLLYQLEEHRDRTIAHYVQDRLQEALDAYRPMCSECDFAMSKHHPRSIITKDGELRLSIPKFRCCECGQMRSGVEFLGDEKRNWYSKKPERKR